MTDTLPTGVKLVGGVYINNEFALYHLSGNALSVLVGDLEPGESAEITFAISQKKRFSTDVIAHL